MENDTAVDNIIQELRRGAIVLAVLGHLREEKYGYSILKELADLGLDLDQGTLYPLLRRLEGQGLLESRWKLEEARPRRYYVISSAGRQALPLLAAEMNKISGIVTTILAE
jgi:PadR family transcriptional regulator, regulatory protein PadR